MHLESPMMKFDALLPCPFCGSKGEYDIVSMGKDGQPGGSGENADISSQ